MICSYPDCGTVLRAAYLLEGRCSLHRPPVSWKHEAACAEYPIITGRDPWFPEYSSTTRAARNQWGQVSQLEATATRICLTKCKVLEPCLRYALAMREDNGIWAGTDPAMRRRFSRTFEGDELVDKLLEQARRFAEERGIIGSEEAA